MAAQGYPGTPTKGTVIEGLDAAAGTGAMVFHASTARDAEGRIIANGGRVLNVTALGATVGEAQAAAYRAVDSLRWPGGFCPPDLGLPEVARASAGRPVGEGWGRTGRAWGEADTL